MHLFEKIYYLRPVRKGIRILLYINHFIFNSEVMGSEDFIPGFSIEAFNNQDESAFTLVYQQFYRAILFFSRNMIDNIPAAEEIAEDVFVKLWSRAANFQSLNKIKAFLYIAASNASRDYLKLEARRSKRVKDAPDLLDRFEEASRHALIKEEVLREIAKAIEELPNQCRTVMKMAYFEGMLPADISAQLQISVSTVRNQQARGIILLRKKLSRIQFSMLAAILSGGLL